MVRTFHIPGRPTKPKPDDLQDVSSSIRHPDIIRTGITATREGEWAILTVVKDNVSIPLIEVGMEYERFPVIYQKEFDKLPIARPAYPSLGE
ncbi:MAG: hypothetical protein AAF944_09790 [Bacteroidota bacterium]